MFVITRTRTGAIVPPVADDGSHQPPQAGARMTRRDGRRMREYWDERARVNAPWYVDTSLSFDEPDMERFFESGREIVSVALESAPVAPPSNGLAVEIGSGLGRMCVALA